MKHFTSAPLLVLLTTAIISTAADISVIERGPHHAIWGRVTAHTTHDGRKFLTTNSYTELATGKHYQRDGQWVPAVAEIAILPSGFGVATQLQHKVIFAPNINTAGAIDCLTPDDKRLRGHVLGLAYTDKSTGRGVMIAEIRDTTGVLVENNQVLYPDAFESEGGFRADIRYTVTIAGLEQDIILVESPPDPRIYGIDPANCRLEVYSEFVEFPEVSKEVTILNSESDRLRGQLMAEPDLVEETLIFGAMRMGQGSAFRLPAERDERLISMGKTWEQREQRQLLIERVDYSSIEDELARLPQAAQLQKPKKALLLRGAGAAWASFLPARPRNAQASLQKLRTKQMAQLQLPRQGLVLDYIVLNGSMTSYVFLGDRTYYISDHTYLYETTVLEGGTCIKFAAGPDLNFMGPLECRTSAFRPAYLTAKDDNSIGELISGSTGTPAGRYARHSMACKSAASVYDLHDLRIRHATYGVSVWTPAQAKISHVQIGRVDRAVAWQQNCVVDYWNFLFYDVVNAFYGTSASATNRAQNGTIHRAHNFISNTSHAPALTATNCLLIAVTNNIAFNTGSHNETNINDSGVFQTVGYGARYLANNSAYRNAGTTNINPSLLADLRKMTTYPPLVITNAIATNTTLARQAQRDTDAVDLGAHYLAADWLVGGLSVTGATLTVQGGATVLIDAANTNWGIRLEAGGHLVSEGDPVNLNRFVRTHSVQEIPAGSGMNTAPMFADTYPASIPSTSIHLRFTDVAQVQKDFAFHQLNNQGTFTSLIFYDSQFRGGTNYLSLNSTNQSIGITNVLFENASLWIYPYPATTLRIANCTFKSGFLGLYIPLGSDWRVHNNIFDYTIFSQGGSGTLTNDHNGYLTNAARLSPNGLNDVVLATNNANFQKGPLGSYYLPPGSGFIDKGSVTNAGLVGLWHYTTQTSQTPETGSRLDLGMHYVALNALGEPEDSNTPTNGVPNYIEDPDGDGLVDPGESPFTTVLVSITSPTNGAVFDKGQNVWIDATASAAFSSIGWVEFYYDTNLLGQDTSAPFSFAWNNLPAGIHALTARAYAQAGILATSAPVSITVYGALFVVGNTNLSSSDNAVKGQLESLGFFPLVTDDTQSSSNDANGKRLILISKTVTSAEVETKFTYHMTPSLCWEDPLLDNLKMTDTVDGTDYGSTTGQTQLTVTDPAHPMATNLSDTITVTTAESEFSWGVPGSNAVKVAQLTGNPNRFGIFGYESNALMFGLEAPSRRAASFLGNVNTANLTDHGWKLFDAAVRWVTGTNSPPTVNWGVPTNGSIFVASTNINLSAMAFDLDSGLKKVNFYRTGVRIGQADTVTQQTNYSLVWSNAIAGNHVLSAKAFDQGGLSSTSAQFVAITVLSNALFVTGSPTLNASETNLKARIESLGFVVTTKAATNVSTADASGKTVVVISSTAAAADITNKFTYVPSPIVVWQKDLFDDLGFTRTNATDSGIVAGQTQLTISSSHALAAGLSGTVTVTTAGTDFTWAIPGSNALAIVSVVGDSAKVPIFGYDKGVSMAGIGTNTLAAPARRVGFFLSDDTAASLDADGWKLFDAAILWAAAKPCSTSVDVMLAIDVSQSLSTKDFVRAKAAASNFVNFLSLGMDRVGLVSFASNSILEVALTTNLNAVQAAIIGLTNRGGTLLEPPITMCQSNLASSPAGVGRLLLLLSDGEINQDPEDDHRTNALNAAQAAKDAGTRIVTLAYDNDDPGLALLQGIASSAADYYYSPDISDLTDIYATIADTICRFDEPPSIAITNPIAGATFVQPATIAIAASASDEHGQVSEVEFFAGGVSLGIDTSSPWSFTWTNAPTGQHTLTASARDNASLSSTSAPVVIEVRARPAVTINTPTNGQELAAPATIYISATASDVDGSITNVSFFFGTTNLAQFTVEPFVYAWSNLFGGGYTIRAEARDNHGLSATSQVSVVVVKQPPSIQIHNPAHNSSMASPLTLEVKTAPTDPDGHVTKVEFFENTTRLRIVTNAPFHMAWTNIPAGSHTVKAVAWDNDGLTNTSTNITFTVGSCTTNQIVSLLLSTNWLEGAMITTGTVSLASVAAAGGQAVALTALAPAISIPVSVLVPEGATNVSFRVDTVTVSQTVETQLAASLYGSTVFADLTVQAASLPASNMYRNPCGPMDVAFLVSYGHNMQDAVWNIRRALSNATHTIELASGGDYRLALIGLTMDIHVFEPFAMTNRETFVSNLVNIVDDENLASDYQPSDEALKMVINSLSAENRPQQHGHFTNGFRAHARKIIVLMVEHPPGGFADSAGGLGYDIGIDDVNAHRQAVEAWGKDIQINAFLVGAHDPNGDVEAIPVMQDYARVSGGIYTVVPYRAANYEDVALPLGRLIAQCGADGGEVVYVRDDRRKVDYSAIKVTHGQKEALCTEMAQFDTSGIAGPVLSARLRRSGQLRVNYGSHFALQIGVQSMLDNNLSSYGILLTNVLGIPVGAPYSGEWELPFPFYDELEQQLGATCAFNLADRVSAGCGNNFEILDFPSADFPAERNSLVLRTVGRFQIPQGRCRDLVLSETNAPVAVNWEIYLWNEMIACSCSSREGWSVEPDYTVYGGINICVPTNAVVASWYEVRWKDGQGVGHSGLFEVIPGGSLDTAPVLLPLEVSSAIRPTNSPITVKVKVDAPAPLGGAIVSLSSTALSNGVPSHVVIPSGETQTEFGCWTPDAVPSNSIVEITASYNGYRKATILVVDPAGFAPDNPTGVHAEATLTGLRVAWDPVPDALYYRLERRGDCDAFEAWNTIADRLTDTCYYDDDVVLGTTNCYRVVAVNAFGEGYSQCDSPYPNCAQVVAILRPLISPPSGKFYDGVTVSISNMVPGAAVYYTTNGVSPTSSDALYTAPFLVTTNTVVKARAFVDLLQSEDATRDYLINIPRVFSCGSNATLMLALTNWPSPIRGAIAERFSFSGISGQRVSIRVSAPDFDPYVMLIDPAGNVVAETGTKYTPRVTEVAATLVTNGNFVIDVTPAGHTGYTGPFTLSLDCDWLPLVGVLVDGASISNFAALDFGITPTNVSVQKVFTITNWGATNLYLGGPTVGPTPPYSASATVMSAIAPSNYTNVTVTFNSAVTGLFAGGFSFTYEPYAGFDNQFYVDLLGRANPSGTPPQVNIASPTNGQWFTTPTNLTIVASGTAGSSAISQVDFYLMLGRTPVLLGSDTSSPYQTVWGNTVSGQHTLRAVVTDSAGRVGLPGTVSVFFNNPPTPAKDFIAVFEGFTSNPLDVLGNDTDPDKDALTITNVGSPTNGTVTWSNTQVFYTPTNGLGRDHFTYTVSDGRGGTATTNISIVVRPLWLPDEFEQTAILLYPTNDSEITAPVTVTGTALSPYLHYWELSYRRRSAIPAAWKPFAEGASEVTTNALGTFDPTGLANGIYELKLKVVDVVDGATLETWPVTVHVGEALKVGQFTVAFNDLEIPVSGLPISLVRTYDSRDTEAGEFGAGWRLDVRSARLEKTGVLGAGWGVVSNGLFYQCVLPSEPHLVTITFPNDQKFRFEAELGLNYTPDPCTVVGGLSAAQADFVFKPLPGTTGTLAPLHPPGNLDLNILLGDAVTLHEDRGDVSVLGPIYDPAEFVFTTLDGRRFEFNAQGKVVKMTDRNGNTLTFTDDGIIHSSGKSVKFVRDTAGRISEIYDPIGLNGAGEPAGPPAIIYRYDALGNLITVQRLTERASATNYLATSFGYDNAKHPHYLTSIVDPRGITGIRNEYDAEGRLKSTTDATGKTITLTHDINGRTETVVDRLGFTNVFKYDARGNVTNSVDALGNTNRFAYDANNNLTMQEDASGNTNFFAYDAQGNRTEIVDALNRTNRFSFDFSGSLVAHLDPLGNVTSNRYDNAGNLTSISRLNRQGQIVEQSFSTFAGGHLVETRNGNNQVTATFGYDSYGNLTNAVDANQVNRTFQYDANGNQTNVSYAWVGPGGSNIVVNVSTEYDAEGKVIRSIDVNGNESRTSHSPIGKPDFTIDRFGNTNRFVYDSRGALIQVTYPNGTFTRTVYDDNGRAICTTDRNQITGTRTEYDALGRVTNSVRLTGVSINIVPDADNPSQMRSFIGASGTPLSSNLTEYLANGWVKSRTGPDGKKTTYDYWADGQVKSITDALTNTTYFEYDAAGRQKLVRDALNRTNRFEYDSVGRLTRTIFPNNSYMSNVFNSLGQKIGHVDQAGLLTQLAYDVSGALTNVTKPLVPDPENSYAMTAPVWSYEHDPYGRLAVIRDPKGRTNTFSYDAVGRPVTKRLPMGQSETNEYNAKGQLWKKYDFKGQKTELVYDNFGRVAAKFYFHAGAAYPSNAVCYQYNQLDQLWKIVERSGEDATTNACDGYASMVGLPPGATGPSGGLMARLARVPSQTVGGLSGLVLLMIAVCLVPSSVRQRLLLSILEAWRMQRDVVAADVRKRKYRLHLPAVGWRVVTVIAIIALLGSDPHFGVLFTARAACPMPANLSTETTRITEFGYDDEGRLTQVNAPEGVINYGYDLATGRHTSTCTTNSEVAYAYDELGRLKTVSVLKRNGATVSPPEVTTYTYTAVGSRQTVTLPNGVVSTYEYDTLNRLTNLTHQTGTTNLASYAYQLYPTGRRTNAIEVLLNTDDNTYVTNTLSWSYDGLYRLTNEVSTSSLSSLAYTRQYEYDTAGNRVKQTRGTETITYQYNANDQVTNEVSSVNGTTTYAYDANGSLTNKTTSGGTVSYAYNLANKLSSVTAGGVTTGYLYNDQGIRVRSSTAGSATHYLVDANNHTGYAQILEELAAAGSTPSRSYVLGDDVLGQATSTTTSWLLYDGHGSTRQLVKAAADVTSQYHFDAYGASVTTLPSDPETSLLYCGEQFDSALQMYNLRARYYDQATGRFNQRDPYSGNIFDPQSLHKYTYGHGDPVNQTDPSGRAIAGSVIQLLIVVGVILNIASFIYHQGAASKAFATGQNREGAINQAWAMVDLAFLLIPGAGAAGPGGRAALAYVGGRIGQTGAGLLRAGVHASAVWGWVSASAMVATESGAGDSGDGGASGDGGSGGANDGPGRWEPEPGQWHWSPEAQAFQWQITGRLGECYWYNGKRFDGWEPVRKVFLEAKSASLADVMLSRWWQKLYVFRDVWRTWAEGRVKAAGNIPVEAHFANKELADEVRKALGGDFPSVKITDTAATTVLQ